MKKIQPTIVSICLILSIFTATKSFSQTKLMDYVINGTIKGINPVPTKVCLNIMYTTGTVADTTVVTDGKYQFKGTIDRVRSATIMSASSKMNTMGTDFLSFMIDQGETGIISEQDLKSSKFSATSPEATRSYNEMLHRYDLVGDTIRRIMYSEEYKTSVSLQEALQLKLQSVMADMRQSYTNFVKRNPKSHASTFLFINQIAIDPSITIATADSLYKTLPLDQQNIIKEEYASATEKKKVAEELAAVNSEKSKKFSVGQMAEDFVQKDNLGNDVSLSSFKGKYVLIDFWASWCAPCRAENPNVVKVFDTYKDKGFTVLGISLDGERSKDAWLKAIQTDGLKWTQVSDLKGFDNTVARTYGVTAIPQNFLIDPTGKIVAVNLRGKALEEKISSIFK